MMWPFNRTGMHLSDPPIVLAPADTEPSISPAFLTSAQSLGDLPKEINSWYECEDCQTWWLKEPWDAVDHAKQVGHSRIFHVSVVFTNPNGGEN